MGGMLAFRTGLARSLRYWPALGLSFAVNLLSAALLALLPAAGLWGASYRTPFRHTADGIDPWLVLETLMSAEVDSALDQPDPGSGLPQILLTGLVVIAAAAFLAWLTSAFLSGGFLVTYAESPQHVEWRRFLWACWQWFGAFLLLGIVQGVVVVVLGLPLALFVVALALGPLRWLGAMLGLLLAGLALAGLALAEYAGAFMVLRNTRNPFAGIGHASRFLLQNPRRWMALYLLALLLLVVVNLIYHFGLSPFIPLAWWPLLLALRQVFVAARLWARTARWAGVVATIETFQTSDV
jgi:hypothetical protein